MGKKRKKNEIVVDEYTIKNDELVTEDVVEEFSEEVIINELNEEINEEITEEVIVNELNEEISEEVVDTELNEKIIDGVTNEKTTENVLEKTIVNDMKKIDISKLSVSEKRYYQRTGRLRK